LVALVGFVAPDWTIRLLQAAAWPAVVAVAVFVLLRTPEGLQFVRAAFSRIRRVTALGVELELTEAAAKAIHYNIQSTFDEYRKRINSEYDRQVRIRQVEDKLARVVQQTIRDAQAGKDPDGYRC